MLMCRKCGKEFSGWQRIGGLLKNLNHRKFCLDCSPFGGHNTRAVLDPHSMEERKCKFCGKELGSPSKKWRGKYCNISCQKGNEWNEFKALVERSKVFPARRSPVRVKRYLKESMGAECDICHITDWMGKGVPLVLDHIDGNPENWNLSNVRLICGNCDMQTPTCKGKNKGHGRFARMMRYREGKSY